MDGLYEDTLQLFSTLHTDTIIPPAYKSTTVSPLQSNPATRSFSVMFPAENMHLVTSNSYLKQRWTHFKLRHVLVCIHSCAHSIIKLRANKLLWLIRTETYLILLSTCLTQQCCPNRIVTTGDLNPSLDIRLIFARRFAPSPLATAIHSCLSRNVKAISELLCTPSTKENCG